ncbi:MAG: sigma-70 family RNA polymerase sigma factor [Oscillospiraceae bacterium]|nr:sigma-70 family RNA polymerase sigma factor [Oscillospiraceae bacterium]
MEDSMIIDLFFERSETAIRELDIKYGEICRGFSNNILGSRQDAEECVNDAYLGVWNSIPPARPEPLLSFVIKIVRNISLNAYHKKEAAKRRSSYTVAMEEIEGCLASSGSVEGELEAKELAGIIGSFLDTLSAENRAVFMRRYWLSESYEKIAEEVGLSEKNVSVKLVRIRKSLKAYLKERGVVE